MSKNNYYKKISTFSPKINLVGLTEDEKRIINEWYCSGKHIDYGKNKLIKNIIRKKAINTFEKALYQIGIFKSTTQIEIINDFTNKSEFPVKKHYFTFKCKDSNEQDIIVTHNAGGGYDSVPTLNITTKDSFDIYEMPFVGFSAQPSIKKVDNEYIQGSDAVAREEYNKIFNQKKAKDKEEEKVIIRVPKTSNNINTQEIEQEKENTIKKL